jgi:hypothetical protein
MKDIEALALINKLSAPIRHIGTDIVKPRRDQNSGWRGEFKCYSDFIKLLRRK